MSKQSNGSLFSLDDFRPYMRAWAQSRGRGEFRKISTALGMHTTLLSQVVTGRKCFTEEQASRLCGYMALSPLETDYFMALILRERAGTADLKGIYLRHLVALRGQAKEAKSRVPEAKELNDSDRAIFYSSWQYSLVRLLTSLNRYQRPEEIARRLNLSISRVKEILDFLVSRGLCNETRDRRYERTGKNTHIEARSPLAVRHHQNWRCKCLELHERMAADDLAFTAPVSLSRKDLDKVKAILLDAISGIAKVVEHSPAEEIAYLGIDWIRI